jgi:membrane-associated phospholipid phosphatase
MRVLASSVMVAIVGIASAARADAPNGPVTTEPTGPAYQLHAETDLPVLGISAVAMAARLTRRQRAYCAPLCDASDVNAFDRSTAGFYSPDWAMATDFGIYALVGGAAATLVLDEGFSNALGDLVVITESGATGLAVSAVLTLATNRPRPFMYGEKAPLSVRDGPDGAFSYSSSHATLAFALATSTFVTTTRLHPGSKDVVWIGGAFGAVAAFVATGRVFAGMHFVTDAVGGAVVGTSTGVLVPALHGSPVRIVPVVGDGQRGIGILGTF